MRHGEVKEGQVYLWTEMHGSGYGRKHTITSYQDGPVLIVPPLPDSEGLRFCAKHKETGDLIEVYPDELSCCERKPGSRVAWGDDIDPGTVLIADCTEGAEVFLIHGHPYTFRRWSNQFTLQVEELYDMSGGFRPERFVYA